MATLESRLALLADRLADEINTVRGEMAASAGIDDGVTDTDTTWSSDKITAFVNAATAALVAGSPAALNTLDELAAALGDDANFAATTATALGNRVRTDTAAQGLDGTQKSNARTNIDAASVASVTTVSNNLSTLTTNVGNTDQDLVAVFEAGLT